MVNPQHIHPSNQPVHIHPKPVRSFLHGRPSPEHPDDPASEMRRDLLVDAEPFTGAGRGGVE